MKGEARRREKTSLYTVTVRIEGHYQHSHTSLRWLTNGGHMASGRLCQVERSVSKRRLGRRLFQTAKNEQGHDSSVCGNIPLPVRDSTLLHQ